jgi:serine/threonine protein kinase
VSNEYQIIKPLGKGSYGEVKLAKHIKSQQFVAIKLMTDFDDGEYNCLKTLREIQIMKGLR